MLPPRWTLCLASMQKKNDSFLKDHRALYQQKLNDLKTLITEKARTLELSADTQKLLECYNSVTPESFLDVEYESVTYTVNKKGYDQATLTFAKDFCTENFKPITLRDHVYCDTPYGGLMINNEQRCIQDDDACPEDYSALLYDLAVALQLENVDPIDYFFKAAYYTQEKCLLQQCFPMPSRSDGVTFTLTSNAPDPLSPYTCPEIGGTCEVDCEDDADSVCVSGLCYGNQDFDEDLFLSLFGSDVAESDTTPLVRKRQLKASKAPKGSKASKSPKAAQGECTCKVPRIQQD